jgi:hypothetical protein
VLFFSSLAAAQTPAKPDAEMTFGYLVLSLGDGEGWKKCMNTGCQPDQSLLEAFYKRCTTGAGEEILVNMKPSAVTTLEQGAKAITVHHFLQNKKQRADQFCNIENAQAAFNTSFVKVNKFVTNLDFDPQKCLKKGSLICAQKYDGSRPDQECQACSLS